MGMKSDFDSLIFGSSPNAATSIFSWSILMNVAYHTVINETASQAMMNGTSITLAFCGLVLGAVLLIIGASMGSR